MSRYARLVCEDSREYIFLGKAIGSADGADVRGFWIGALDPVKPFESELYNRVLWTFLARNARRNLRVVLDYQDDFEVWHGFREIGGDDHGDISFEEYLASNPWP